MKKRFTLVAALTALAVLVSAAIPALAQDESQVGGDADHASPPGLGIEAPGTAPVGQEVTITVLDRQTTAPVQGAGVWAVSREKVGDLTDEIASLGEGEGNDSQAGVDGVLIGWSDENGQVTHTFEEAGVYLLVAVKDGYFPGFALMRVRGQRSALGIRAPRVAPVGEDVTINVFERQSKAPVEGAGVWLVSKEDAEGLKADIAQLRQAGNAAAPEEAYLDLVSAYGEPLDFTDENGQVTHAFGEAGLYFLVAVKDGYLPGFAPVHVKSPRLALAIRAPRLVPTGEEVTVGVFDRRARQPVEGAGVWLLSRESAAGLKAEIARLKRAGGAAAAGQDYTDLVSARGEFLDLTDENGQVRHTFEEAGAYLLVAVKDGYFPGFQMIRARSARTAGSANAAGSARVLRAAKSGRPDKADRPEKPAHAARPVADRSRAGDR